MTRHLSFLRHASVLALTLAVLPVPGHAAAQAPAAAKPAPAMPRYSGDQLTLPADYQRWVFVGASLGLSYSQAGGGAEMFHETLMEPTAYEHFVSTGTFREGTMMALLLHPTGEGVLPSRRGRFAAELATVEMAVKDTARRREGWAYYNFGGRDGIRTTATALPKESCFACHQREAKRDNVFLQFYPLLASAAPASAGLVQPQAPAAITPAAPPLAVKGLDPVLLVDGREEMGKTEIVEVYQGYRYQFVSEPNRAAFTKDPKAFSIQNDTCLVVPGATINPELFVVHQRKILAFATPGCIDAFRSAPANFLPKP